MTSHHDPTAPSTDIDPRLLLGRAITTAGSVIAEIRPDQLDDPTPCSEMDVRTLVGHLIGVLGRITALGRGDDPFAVVETDLTGQDLTTAWSAAVDDVTRAWHDDEVLERPMALPWVQGTGAQVLTSYFSELTVHTWDLATATGQAPEWDDELVAAALAASRFLPAENRRALFEEVSAAMGLDEVAIPFAEAVPVGADAPAIDRLVAWNGRHPTAWPR